MKNCKNCVFCNKTVYGYIEAVKHSIVLYKCILFRKDIWHPSLKAIPCMYYLPRYVYEEAEYRKHEIQII